MSPFSTFSSKTCSRAKCFLSGLGFLNNYFEQRLSPINSWNPYLRHINQDWTKLVSQHSTLGSKSGRCPNSASVSGVAHGKDKKPLLGEDDTRNPQHVSLVPSPCRISFAQTAQYLVPFPTSAKTTPEPYSLPDKILIPHSNTGACHSAF